MKKYLFRWIASISVVGILIFLFYASQQATTSFERIIFTVSMILLSLGISGFMFALIGSEDLEEESISSHID